MEDINWSFISNRQNRFSKNKKMFPLFTDNLIHHPNTLMMENKLTVPSMPYKNFNRILLESIEDVFKQILGDEATMIISRYIERKGSITWKNIPRRIEVLNEGLRELLGSGSIPIENLILENLYSKLGLNFEKNEDWTFLDYIKKLNNNTK